MKEPWVFSKPGVIEIRGQSIAELARRYSFLEAASKLMFNETSSGAERIIGTIGEAFDNPELERCLLASPDLVAGICEALRRAENLRCSELRSEVYSRRAAAVLFLWAAAAASLLRDLRGDGGAFQVEGFVEELANQLSDRVNALRDEEVTALERHMVLQLESPHSPSSRVVRRAIYEGENLADALILGVGRFWHGDHGTASADADHLLLELRNHDDIAFEVRKRLRKGERLPGFGSHEHKGASVDPRLLIYQSDSERLRRRSNNPWPWEVADELIELMGKKRLSPNPDLYMALIHRALEIPSERMPLSFLLSRLLGWCSAYLEPEDERVSGSALEV